jgi:preprotein translocase subunit SecG
MLTVLLTVVHVIVCAFLVVVVLLQSGKAADLAGAFGGMGSQTAFGPRGAATVLSKATTIAAALFMVTSLTLAILATRHAGTGSSVLERQKDTVKKATPAAPSQTPPTGLPGGALPGGAVAPGQPSVTLTPEGGGPSRTIPLDINKLPRVNPNQTPAQSAPAPAK